MRWRRIAWRGERESRARASYHQLSSALPPPNGRTLDSLINSCPAPILLRHVINTPCLPENTRPRPPPPPLIFYSQFLFDTSAGRSPRHPAGHRKDQLFTEILFSLTNIAGSQHFENFTYHIKKYSYQIPPTQSLFFL